MVPVRHWGTSTLFGLVSTNTVSRTDYRCQGCGAAFRVLPWHAVRSVAGGVIFLQLAALFGFLLCSGLLVLLSSPWLGLGLGFGGLVGTVVSLLGLHWSLSSSWYVWRNPVVPGAAAPQRRYGEVDRSRRCTCGGIAPVQRVVANTTNGVPTGTDSFHACSTCGTAFKVEDTWGLVFTSILGTVLFPIALLLIPGAIDDPEPFSIGMAAVLGLAGLACYAMTLSGIRARWLHPLTER